MSEGIGYRFWRREVESIPVQDEERPEPGPVDEGPVSDEPTRLRDVLSAGIQEAEQSDADASESGESRDVVHGETDDDRRETSDGSSGETPALAGDEGTDQEVAEGPASTSGEIGDDGVGVPEEQRTDEEDQRSEGSVRPTDQSADAGQASTGDHGGEDGRGAEERIVGHGSSGEIRERTFDLIGGCWI